MLATIIDDVSNIFHNVWNWFQTLTPGGFGLILIPLIILGTITILVSRNRYGRPRDPARPRRGPDQTRSAPGTSRTTSRGSLPRSSPL